MKKITPALQKNLSGKSGGGSAAGLLREGETLRMVAQIHWGIYWKGALLLMLALLLMTKVFNLGVFLLFVAAIILSMEYLTKHYLLLALTDKRVIVRYGVLNLEVIQLHFNRIESVEVFHPPIGRLLGYATVMVTGTGSRATGIPFVGNAHELRAEIDQIIFDREEKRGASSE